MGADPVKAKNEGLIVAEKQGLSALLEKFAPDLREGLIQTLDAEMIDGLLHSKEVVSESLNGNRYRAKIRLNFSALKVNTLIDDRIKALQSDQVLKQPSSLVFPILLVNDKRLLFEPKNLWRKAWVDSGISHRSGMLILPYGDMNDLATITAEEAIKQEYKDFSPILRRYGVRDAVVAIAELTGSEKKRELKVLMRRVQATKESITRYQFPADPGVDDMTLMQQACAELASHIDGEQAATQVTINSQTKNAGVQLVVVGVRSPKNYALLRQKIATLPQVDNVEMVAFSATQADLQVYYHGTAEQLQEALRALKVRLTVLPNYWTVEEGV